MMCSGSTLQRYEQPTGLSTFLPPSRGDVERELALSRGRRLSDVGLFGAISNVTVPSNVAEIFGEISETIQAVLRLSVRLATLPSTDRTRETVRACRNLAVTLQEELETRRGR